MKKLQKIIKKIQKLILEMVLKILLIIFYVVGIGLTKLFYSVVRVFLFLIGILKGDRKPLSSFWLKADGYDSKTTDCLRQS